MITIALPYPPATNNLFRNAPGKGRVPTERYKTWRRVAETEIMAQRVQWPEKKLAGPVAAIITLQRKDNRKRDLDNLCKAPLDTLTRMGVLADDSQVHCLTVQWGEVEGCRVELWAMEQRRAA